MGKELFIIAALGTFLTFGGCFGGGSTTTEDGRVLNASVTLYEAPAFSMGVPTNWVEIPREDVPTLEKHFQLAFAKPEYVNGFSSNLTVVTEDLVFIDDSIRYAQANMISASRDIIDYDIIDKRDFTIENKDESYTTMIHVFSGRYRTLDPLSKYIQTYLVKGNKGYIITVNIPFSEDDYEKYIDNIFRTFRFN